MTDKKAFVALLFSKKSLHNPNRNAVAAYLNPLTFNQTNIDTPLIKCYFMVII